MKKKLFLIIISVLALAPLALPAQSYAAFPLGIAAKTQDLVADNNGNLHLVWVTSTNAIYYGRIVPDGNGGFTVTGQQLVVAANAKASQWTRPRMAVRSDGSTVHIVYLESDTQVKHSWRNSSGAWSTEYIRNGSSNYAFPSIGVNANGTLHFIAQRWGKASPIIYLKKPVGGAWSSDVAISDTTAEYRDCAMFTDPAGGIHATWHAANRPGYYRYAPQGTDLNKVSTMDIPRREGVSTNCFGDLFVRSDGQVHTAFATWGVEKATIDHSLRNSGGSFQVPTCASGSTIDNDDRDCWPAVVADALRIYVVWAESFNGTSFATVRLATKTGTAWTQYTADGTAAVYPYSKPSVTLTSAGLFGVWRSNMFAAGQLVLGVVAAPTTITVTAPNGGESWESASTQDITWTSTGILTSVNIDCSTDGGSSWTRLASNTANDGLFSWTVPDTPSIDCRVRVSDPDGSPYDDSNAAFTIFKLPVETVSAPGTPAGRTAGSILVNYRYSGSGAASNLGHDLQYKFDWGDGSDSGWLAVATTSASHAWAAAGAYSVRAMARCAEHPAVESLWSEPLAVAIYPSLQTGCDFNEDNATDLLWRHVSTGKNLIWFMDGVSKTGSASLPTQADLDWELVQPADFNGDGKTDLLWRHLTTGKNLVWYMNGVSRTGSASLPTQADLDWELAECADFNGDGMTDVVWRQKSTGRNSLWYMNGVSRIGTTTLPTLGDVNWVLSGSGDFNGDAKTDILWRNPSTGRNAVWYMNGSSWSGTAYLTSLADPNWKIADCADFNGDNKPDILWRNTLTGQNAVWYMNGASRTGTAYMPDQADMNWELKN